MAVVDIDRAIRLLKSGEAVAFPTETVYGLGADCWNTSAIGKVFDIKGRPSDNPLIVHVSDNEMVAGLAEEIPEVAARLMEKFWPGPLTIVLKKRPGVPDLITGGLSTVALRCPDHPLALQLISEAGPLVAPSANRSGRPSPTKAEHVLEDFGPGFPVLDGGQTQIGIESTVLDATTTPLSIYRPGEIGREELENTTGEKVIYNSTQSDGATKSPGIKYTHYAPVAVVQWLENRNSDLEDDALYLYHSSDISGDRNVINYTGDYSRMGSELYDRFRQADREGYIKIYIQRFDDKTVEQNPFVHAIHNRITKAAGG